MPRPSTLTIANLKQMLHTRRAELAKLQKSRAGLLRELASLDRSISRIGGIAGSKGGRARNEQSLTETLQTVLKSAGKPMGVGEILEAVEATGYRLATAPTSAGSSTRHSSRNASISCRPAGESIS